MTPSDSSKIVPTRRVWTKSVRFQLTFWYVTALGILLATVGSLVYTGLQATLLHSVDATLASEAAEVTTHLIPFSDDEKGDDEEETWSGEQRVRSSKSFDKKDLTAVTIPGLVLSGLYLRVARASDRRTLALSPPLEHRLKLASALAALPPPTPGKPSYAFVSPDEDDQARCLTVPIPSTGNILQVAVLWDLTEDLLTKLAWAMTGAVLLFLLLSGIGSWVLVGRAFRPMDAIVTEAERLTADSMTPLLLSPRVHSDDEVGHLVMALNGMMSRLHAAFAAQRRFAADASHELSTPLTILQGELELALARERPAEAYRETLQSSLEETRRMARIVESLSLLARGDALGRSSAARQGERIAIDTLAAETVRGYRERADRKGVRLLLEPGEPPLMLSGNADMLALALRNLLDNAVTYTPEGGMVTVSIASGRNRD